MHYPFFKSLSWQKKILNSLMIGGVGTKIENEMLYNILNRATLFRKVWILCLNMNTIQDSCTLLLSMKMSTTSLRVSLTTLTKPMLWIYIALKLNYKSLTCIRKDIPKCRNIGQIGNIEIKIPLMEDLKVSWGSLGLGIVYESGPSWNQHKGALLTRSRQDI